MKKFKLILVMIGIFVFFPKYVNAATSLTASTQAPVVGSSIYVQLNIDYGKDKLISSAHYNIYYDSNKFELENVIWTQSKGTYEVRDGYIRIDKESSTANWEYGGQVQFKFKVKAVGLSKITISNDPSNPAKFSDGYSVSETCSGVTINAVEANSKTNLKSLSVANYTISPTFSRNVYNYTLTVPSSETEVEVLATKADETQIITGIGKKTLQYGANKVNVVVKAQNGQTQTYTIMITRQDDRTGDTSLKDLSISNANVKFDKENDTYEAIVSKSIDKVLITAQANDSKATLIGTGTKELQIGLNTFELKIQTSGNVEKIYKINITRSEEELQEDVISNKLISLKVDGTLLDLNEEQTTFLYGTNSSKKNLTITAITESKTAKIEIEGNERLRAGINIININVIESDQTSTVYTLIVNKNSPSTEEISSLEEILDSDADSFTYNTTDDKHILPKDVMEEIKSEDKVLYYNIVNEYKGLIYQAKIDNKIDVSEIDLDFNKSSDNPLTYTTSMPSNVEMSLYIGNVYQDGITLKIYNYDESGNYTLLTEGVEVANGYINFTTNGADNYVFTPASLTETNNIFKNFKFILIPLIIIVAIVSVLLLNKRNGKKVKDKNEPLY